MYRVLALIALLHTTVRCASLNRYDYTTDRYSAQYTTINNLYNQAAFKPGYSGDISQISSQNSRYPNYNPSGYTTKSYGSSGYNTNNGGYNTNNGGYNTNNNGYNTLNNEYNVNNNGYNEFSNTGLSDELYSGYSTPRYADGFSSYEYPFMKNERDYCMNRSPQNGIYVDNLMGMWYGVEYIQHLAGDSRVDHTQTCIVMHLSEPAEEPSTEAQLYHVQHIKAKFRQEYRHLRLLWDEAGRTSEYALYFRNDSAGYWQVVDGQNGTLTRVPGFRHFSGTVQVLKAVNDHLLLSFCQEPYGGKAPQLYSVLFSREPGVMPRWEINSVHTLLQNKKLSVASRRMVCGNSGGTTAYSVIFSVFSCFFAVLISVS